MAATSRSTFGPSMPSPSPVPSMPFLTTSTACSVRAVQVCCTLLPTMGSAWFPASLRERGHRRDFVCMLRERCMPTSDTWYPRRSLRDCKQSPASQRGSGEASVAGGREVAAGHSTCVIDRGRRCRRCTRKHAEAASCRGHPEGSLRPAPLRGRPMHRVGHSKLCSVRSSDLRGRNDPVGPSSTPRGCSARRHGHRIAKSARTAGSWLLPAPFPQARSPFGVFPSAKAGVRVSSAPASSSFRPLAPDPLRMVGMKKRLRPRGFIP
jgi:hypothetical protein